MGNYPEYEEKMNKRVDAFHDELKTIRAGRANASVLDKVAVEYYGTMTPIAQIGSISVPEPRMLVIQPWDQSVLSEIEKAINKSEIGIAPQNDGKVIRLNFPPLTEERRKETAKEVKKFGEDTKVAIRNVRRDMVDSLKKIEKDENLPEDAVKDNQDQIQKITDKYVGIIDSLVSEKEKEVMTV